MATFAFSRISIAMHRGMRMRSALAPLAVLWPFVHREWSMVGSGSLLTRFEQPSKFFKFSSRLRASQQTTWSELTLLLLRRSHHKDDHSNETSEEGALTEEGKKLNDPRLTLLHKQSTLPCMEIHEQNMILTMITAKKT